MRESLKTSAADYITMRAAPARPGNARLATPAGCTPTHCPAAPGVRRTRSCVHSRRELAASPHARPVDRPDTDAHRGDRGRRTQCQAEEGEARAGRTRDPDRSFRIDAGR